MPCEGTRGLSLPISLGPAQEVGETDFFPASLLTAKNQTFAAHAPGQVQPNQCRSPRQRDLGQPTIYAFDNPARRRSCIAHQALRDLFFTFNAISIVLPMQGVEVNDRNMSQSS